MDVPGLGRLDGRTREALAFGEMVRELAEDLGGMDRLSRAQLEHARRAAALAVICSRIEARLMAGEDVDVGTLIAAANAQSRILDRLGLERRAKDVTPDPLAYARARAAAEEGEDAEIARLAGDGA